MKKLTYLVVAALMAMLVLVPTAFAQQEQTMRMERTMEMTQPLPASGGPMLTSPSILLPAAALLLGSGVLGYAALRRR